MKAFAKSLAVVLSVMLMWGCSTTPKQDAAGSGGAASSGSESTMTTTGGNGGESAEVQGISNQGTVAADPFVDPSNLLSKHTVYFDFDRSDIKSQARPIIEAHARYMAEHPNARITLEGHCDERGTREYNLALGERRAKAVQQMMSLLGVAPSQIEVISYGEERPASMGHSESDWALNRRVEIVYSSR